MAFAGRGRPEQETNTLLVGIMMGVGVGVLRTVIFGKKIASEYISLAVLGGTAAIAMAASGGSKKEQPKSLAEKIEKAVPISAGSSEEEQLMDSIKRFIEESEKETH
ncbi:hypothetical protein HDZ31DRAFT_64370 [Schizophyllum fasciatum]